MMGADEVQQLERSLAIPGNEALYRILREEILSLKLAPGSLLSENMLARRFGLSRTLVRGAIKKLELEGLVEVIPKKGTYVSLIDLDLAEQITYMRIQVEIGAMTRLAQMPLSPVFEKLAENLERQKIQLEFGVDDNEFYRLDSQFHELCMIEIGKYKLWKMIQQLDVHYSRYRRMDYLATRQFNVLYRQHVRLYKLMRGGEGAGVRPVLTNHLYGSFLRINTRLAGEYKNFFTDTERTVEEILKDVQKTVLASKKL